MKNKLCSNNGASISIALLIFLVCSVVTSLLLVAGTTSTGYMIQTAKTDQKYYSMTSAAKLLKNKLNNKPVEIKRVVVEESEIVCNNALTFETSKTLQSDKTIIKAEGETEEITNESNIEIIYNSILAEAAYYLVETSKQDVNIPISHAMEKTFLLTSETSGYSVSSIIEESIETDGNIIFKIYNAEKKENQTVYSKVGKNYLKLVFEINKNNTSGTKAVNGPLYNISEDGRNYKYKKTLTTTTVTKLNWNLASITMR